MTEQQLIELNAERQPCEVWTRVMGYFRPVSFWNKGKQGEHAERRYFCEHGAVSGAKKECSIFT